MHLLDHPVVLALESIAVRGAKPLVRCWWWLTGAPRRGLVAVLVAAATVCGLAGAAVQFAANPTGGASFLSDPVVRRSLTVAATAGALVYIGRFVLRIAEHLDDRGERDQDALDAVDVQARVVRATLVVLTVLQAGVAFRGGLLAGLATTGTVALFALAVGATAGDPPGGRTVWDALRGRTPVPVPTS